jgi:hypothetical protein
MGSTPVLTFQAAMLDKGGEIENREEGWISIPAKPGGSLAR